MICAVAACSSTSPRPPAPGRAIPPTPIAKAPEAPPTDAVVGFAARTRMIESRHGGEIATLAVTPDGTAVLSVDEVGGTRLWPVLDGSVEPRVVDLPHGRSVAIGPDPRGFVAGSIDVAGGLTIAVVDRDGLILQRASLPAEPAFVKVAMTSRGMIAIRSDHSIARVGADGAIVERVAVGGGERIAGLAVRGDSIAVQIDGEKRRLRWLLVTPSLRWGNWIPTTIEPEGVIAVSPRGASVALVVGPPVQRWLVVLDTTTGAFLDGEAMGSAANDLAYADEDHIVLGGRGGATRVRRIDAAARRVATVVVSPSQGDPEVLAVGGDRVIGAASAQLAIVGRAGKEYLGYELEAPHVVATAPDGNLVLGLGAAFVQVDATLATVATPDFKLPVATSVAELRHVDGNAWIVEWANRDNGRTSAALVDLVSGARQTLHVNEEAVHAIGYEPRSRLATFTLGVSNAVFRFDPGTRKLDRIDRKKPITWQTAMTPLASAVAGGNEVLVVTLSDRLALRWVPDARALDKGKLLALEGTFAAADPLGNAYVWVRDGGAFALLIVRDGGTTVARLAVDRPVAIAPDPNGKRFVEISRNEVALVSHDGSRAWAIAAPGVDEAHWLTDGGLALVGTGGVARVDTATGAVQAARCGWRFGLSKTPHRSSSRVEPLCTQLR